MKKILDKILNKKKSGGKLLESNQLSQDSKKPDDNNHRVSVTMVYSIPEEVYDIFLNTFRSNMAPWLARDIKTKKLQLNETNLILVDPVKQVEYNIPITQIVEVGRLE